MTDPDIAALAKGLSEGAKRACIGMSDQWQFPGKTTFNANGAWALRRQTGKLCEDASQRDGKWCRAAYRLTETGLRVRAHLQQQGAEA